MQENYESLEIPATMLVEGVIDTLQKGIEGDILDQYNLIMNYEIVQADQPMYVRWEWTIDATIDGAWVSSATVRMPFYGDTELIRHGDDWKFVIDDDEVTFTTKDSELRIDGEIVIPNSPGWDTMNVWSHDVTPFLMSYYFLMAVKTAEDAL